MSNGWAGYDVHLYCGAAGPDNDALDPEADEGGEGSQRDEYIGVVRPGLLDHAAQLSVAVCTCSKSRVADPDSGVLVESGSVFWYGFSEVSDPDQAWTYSLS